VGDEDEVTANASPEGLVVSEQSLRRWDKAEKRGATHPMKGYRLFLLRQVLPLPWRIHSRSEYAP
jgi:hypothetical protein